MKKIFLLLIFCFTGISNAQTAKQTLDEIVSSHLEELRQSIGYDATIFVAFDYDSSTTSLTKKDFFIQPTLDPQKISGNNNFLIKFFFSTKEGQTIVKGINFKVMKKSRKIIELINLGNGKDYKL